LPNFKTIRASTIHNSTWNHYFFEGRKVCNILCFHIALYSNLWLSGSGNYLWMSIIYFWLNYVEHEEATICIGNIILFSIFFFSGATNENSGPAATLIIMLFMFRYLMVEHEINCNSIVGVIFGRIDFVIMIMSPGLQKRGTIVWIWQNIGQNFGKISTDANQCFHSVYLIIVLLIILLLALKGLNKEFFENVTFFMIGHFVSIYSMAFSPDYSDRTFFGGGMGIALFILIYNLFNSYKSILIIVLVLLLIAFSVSYLSVERSISFSHQEVSPTIPSHQ